MGAAREHGILDALAEAGVHAEPTPPTRALARTWPRRSGVATSNPATASEPGRQRLQRVNTRHF
jgi:hypothetical protein